MLANKMDRLIQVTGWVAAFSLVACAIYLGWRALTRQPVSRLAPVRLFAGLDRTADQPHQATHRQDTSVVPTSVESEKSLALPDQAEPAASAGISRRLALHTTIPERPELAVHQYTVEKGDSVFEIAAQSKLKPESVLWANYDLLNDNPDLISLGMQLNIPPVDGVLYQWQAGDTVEAVAGRFKSDPEALLSFPGNPFDLVSRQVPIGTLVMVPGGQREYRQWIIPTIPRGAAGVSKAVYGSGVCEGGYDGAYGSGAFIWPAANHSLSGNDFWSGHLGIDIAAGEGAAIYAADSGVIVFSGWATGGYGNTVVIDHGNGHQTLYAHMNSVNVGCGRSVSQGNIIGYAGSTGNSTGAHLHFEVRFQGGFVNPWYVLPAP